MTRLPWETIASVLQYTVFEDLKSATLACSAMQHEADRWLWSNVALRSLTSGSVTDHGAMVKLAARRFQATHSATISVRYSESASLAAKVTKFDEMVQCLYQMPALQELHLGFFVQENIWKVFNPLVRLCEAPPLPSVKSLVFYTYSQLSHNRVSRTIFRRYLTTIYPGLEKLRLLCPLLDDDDENTKVYYSHHMLKSLLVIKYKDLSLALASPLESISMDLNQISHPRSLADLLSSIAQHSRTLRKLVCRFRTQPEGGIPPATLVRELLVSDLPYLGLFEITIMAYDGLHGSNSPQTEEEALLSSIVKVSQRRPVDSDVPLLSRIRSIRLLRLVVSDPGSFSRTLFAHLTSLEELEVCHIQEQVEGEDDSLTWAWKIEKIRSGMSRPILHYRVALLQHVRPMTHVAVLAAKNHVLLSKQWTVRYNKDPWEQAHDIASYQDLIAPEPNA